MKSKFEKSGDTVIVKLDGKIDYESQEPFKESLRTLERDKRVNANRDSVPTKVIFNLERLEFVGSSGISQLIQTLKDFGARTDQRAHIQNASNEFKKVMRAFDEEAVFEFQDPAPVVTATKKKRPLDQ